MALTYADKLKDPRWQRKRLEILERAGFKCEACDDGKSTLHIHHGYYERGLNPWEYDNRTLWCLCETCHEALGNALRNLHHAIACVHPKDFRRFFHAMLSSFNGVKPMAWMGEGGPANEEDWPVWLANEWMFHYSGSLPEARQSQG